MPFLKAAVTIAISSAALITPSGVIAQEAPYPHRVVTLITHSSPGGGSAMSRLATSPADGSVLYAATPSFIFTSLLSEPAYTYEDLEPVVNVFFDQEVLYTRSDGPFESLDDVIVAAREGRGRWGAATPGSLERRALERLRVAARVPARIVSHDGGGDLILNVLNGTLDVGVGEAQEIRGQLDAGALRLLAVFSERRLPKLPDLPTVRESGYEVVVSKFRGLVGPPDLPPDIVAAWERAIQQVLEQPDYRKAYTSAMLSPAYMSQGEFRRFIAAFADDTTRFLTESGVID
jgi:putative tricarboxylic transport membrane protein